jgi:hypothetical protein
MSGIVRKLWTGFGHFGRSAFNTVEANSWASDHSISILKLEWSDDPTRSADRDGHSNGAVKKSR